MITKSDCMSLLVRLGDNGVNVDAQLRKLMTAKDDVPLDVLKFISENNGMELANFYEMLRRNHNKKKSPLYVNLLRDQVTAESTILTLSCLLQQIILYNNKLSDSGAFLREARAEEISRTMHDYFASGKLDGAIAVLKLVRTDLRVLEYLRGRRDLA